MATSGTVSATVFNTNNILDQAFKRCKVQPATVSSEMQQTALDSLYLLISSLCNRGLQLWTVERLILPFYLGDVNVPFPVGTIDLLNTNYRTLSRYNGTATASSGVADLFDDGDLTTSCAQTSPNGWMKLQLETAQIVTSLGINMKTAGTYNLTVSHSNDNITYTPVLAPGPVSYETGEWHWYDINPSVTAAFWKLTETGGATLDVAEFVVAGNPTEIPIARLNQDDYTNLPNKTFRGRPLQFWLDRQLAYPIAKLWPTPNQEAQFAQFVAWRQRHIMDVGSLTQTIELPQRWVDAITWELAYRLCFELPDVDINMADRIKPQAAEAMMMAFNEERDNSPFMMSPNISMYTR